ncbi:hypothetical protein ACRALDRAFT_1069836 [Sodiomyces alcalophilus JCM 7366]|uniref:uncharacterized protein n=1 Tax=Sodiomyces alcalophilus JCM 7366 TaxID=591952 RepID=UPI0039B67474
MATFHGMSMWEIETHAWASGPFVTALQMGPCLRVVQLQALLYVQGNPKMQRQKSANRDASNAMRTGPRSSAPCAWPFRGKEHWGAWKDRVAAEYHPLHVLFFPFRVTRWKLTKWRMNLDQITMLKIMALFLSPEFASQILELWRLPYRKGRSGQVAHTDHRPILLRLALFDLNLLPATLLRFTLAPGLATH